MAQGGYELLVNGSKGSLHVPMGEQAKDPRMTEIVDTGAAGEKESVQVGGNRILIPERSGDEDGLSSGGEKHAVSESNILGKRSRSPGQKAAQSSLQGFEVNAKSDSPTSASEGEEQEAQCSLRHDEQRPETDSAPQSPALLFPPALEILDHVFAPLNAACGFLQKQHLRWSWQNVKQALLQLSGTDESVTVDEIERLAQLCPQVVAVGEVNGEGEQADFDIELRDPDQPRGVVQLSPSETQDEDARLATERRLRSFRSLLVQVDERLLASGGSGGTNMQNNCAMQASGGSGGTNMETNLRPILPSIPRHLINITMGPPILALPTQNLVVSSSPMLSQQPQSQPTFRRIAKPLHDTPIPMQASPSNSFTFNGPQHQNAIYGGHQTATSSAMQAPLLLTDNGSNRSHISPVPAGDVKRPLLVTQMQMPHRAGRGRGRGRKWDTSELMVLVQAKKDEWETLDTTYGKDTAENRWTKVEKRMKDNRIIDRDAADCRIKWESLLSDYRSIKDWNRKTGNALYSKLTAQERKRANLPIFFTGGLMDLMTSFQGQFADEYPRVMMNSTVRSPGDGSTVAANGGDDSVAEENGNAVLLDQDGVETSNEPAPKRKCSSAGDPSLAALERLTGTLRNIERAKEERSERRLALENKRYDLQRNELDLRARKLEIEREDRRSLGRVLGNLAAAVHRIADKLPDKI